MPFRRLPPLNALRSFEAVARHGSFKAAAGELFVTPAALSQQVRKLEADLGVDLFVRQNRSIAITAAGMRLNAGLNDGFARIREAVESVTTSHDQLVVSCGQPFAAKWLTPRLGDFMRSYPQIGISLSSSFERDSYCGDGVDVGICLSKAQDDSLDSEWLIEEILVPLASPAFIAEHRLREPKDILRVPIIWDDGLAFAGGPTWECWFREARIDPANANRGVNFGRHNEQAIDAAAAGAGVALCRLTLASLDIGSGRLQMPFGPTLDTGVHYQLVHRASAETAALVTTFKNWLIDEMFGAANGCPLRTEPLSASA